MADIEALKRKKRDTAERDRVLQALEEDKKERALRQEQASLVKQEEERSAAASRAQFTNEAFATLNIRTEDGALRHRFEATTTLAEVREWLLEEQNKTVVPEASSHVLSSAADAEVVRAGRENFQRQTARLREEARALRMGDGSAGSRTVIFFVSLMPRAEFLSEELMTTTLRDAGLVPSGTLMVRRQLTMPAPTDAADAAAEAASNLTAFEGGREVADEVADEEGAEGDGAAAGAAGAGGGGVEAGQGLGDDAAGHAHAHGHDGHDDGGHNTDDSDDDDGDDDDEEVDDEDEDDNEGEA